MGTPISRLVTVPTGGCRIQVSAAFEAQAGGTASDWGGADTYRLQFTEYLADGTTYVNGEASSPKPVSTTRMRYTDFLSSTYKLPAGHKVRIELSIGTIAGHSITVWNVDFRIELIKR